MLLANKARTYAGVLPLVPGRYLRTSRDSTREDFDAGVQELTHARFLVIDEDSQEILIRSFVRHHEVIKQPNLTKNMVRSLDSVYSRRILDVLLMELARYLREEPELKGWAEIEEEDPRLWVALCQTMQRLEEARAAGADPETGELDDPEETHGNGQEFDDESGYEPVDSLPDRLPIYADELSSSVPY
ncbi:hypothetical protein [Nesterenkonia flava]|uniref:DUF4194 domain-containing protein n=1 Tax=Nesterenkonia flava TaxID=469799 RepID=A0ABU1FXH5_9MICC|nr:hypothetical protein [Nesterenkonia flava]MDR5712957.1 hypothetical protein [Nesterenkonia flava]